MYRWISGVIVAVALLGVVGAGCGGSDSDSESVAVVPKAQYAKSVEKVCASSYKERYTAATKKYNQKQRKAIRAGDAATQASELEELGEELVQETLIPSFRKQQEDLENLGVPADGEAKVEKMLQSMEEGTDQLEQDGFEKLNYNQFDAFEKEAKAYGLKCKVI